MPNLRLAPPSPAALFKLKRFGIRESRPAISELEIVARLNLPASFGHPCSRRPGLRPSRPFLQQHYRFQSGHSDRHRPFGPEPPIRRLGHCAADIHFGLPGQTRSLESVAAMRGRKRGVTESGCLRFSPHLSGRNRKSSCKLNQRASRVV
jgi:hypothetical protein